MTQSTERHREYLKGWRKRNQDKTKAYRSTPEFKIAETNRHLLRTYKMSLEDKKCMWQKQNGLCAVCEEPLPDVLDRNCQVEHDHLTEKVRGLAHWYCNNAVGIVENRPGLLEKVTAYLKMMR